MADMDRRKLLWLSGLMLGSLVGCARQPVVDNSNAPGQAQSAAGPNSPNQSTAQNTQQREPKEIDGKPTSFVQIAEVQAQIATDESRPGTDRQNAAELAKTNYRRAIKLDPKCLAAYQGMARLCSDLGEHELAIHALDSALAVYPKESQLWYDRGMIMGRQKRYDDAVQNLNQALQIDPNNAKYGKTLGLMLARMGRGDDGVAYLMRWMKEADARYNVARIMEHIGLTAESQRQLQLALKADPTHEASLSLMNKDSVTPAGLR
jgi:Flp pilus assembly protein TadD